MKPAFDHRSGSDAAADRSPSRDPDAGADAGGGVPLCDLRPGDRGRLHAVRLQGHQADHVRALGLHESCDLRICRSARMCIVQVMGGGGPGCRIALDRDLARDVMVTPLTRDGRPVASA